VPLIVPYFVTQLISLKNEAEKTVLPLTTPRNKKV